ncbi:general secretion pathway protein G [Terrimicrobium sacchariphilum]|uniref:General secretion pathway protein G n=1 Tax=Terrimicrobium sacchariphilum TaxID=690879 RepID=A0A146GA77_TERSA|nr:hypothetical protein [Terrimicrobium sacchariphilum]GAT34142.1 general secretion pathway protein G [Terrimicrobium sacchariphilum]
MNKSLHPSGFTLLELIAVVSLVFVLAVLLVPMLRHSQQQAASGACMSNLRNIGSAFHLYAAENNGLLPAMRYRASSVGGNPNPGQNNWQFEIIPYLDVESTSFKTISQKYGGQGVFCPAYIREFKQNTSAQTLKTGGYGMAKISKDAYDSRTAMATIANPSSTILAGDSDDYHLAIDSRTWANGPDGQGRFGSGDPIRHGTTANYLFVDGHILPMTQERAEALLLGTESL